MYLSFPTFPKTKPCFLCPVPVAFNPVCGSSTSQQLGRVEQTAFLEYAYVHILE